VSREDVDLPAKDEPSSRSARAGAVLQNSAGGLGIRTLKPLAAAYLLDADRNGSHSVAGQADTALSAVDARARQLPPSALGYAADCAVAQARYALTHRYALPVMPGAIPEDASRFADLAHTVLRRMDLHVDHWTATPGAKRTLRVTLRDPKLYSVYYVCLNSDDCASSTMWGHGDPLEEVPNHRFSCLSHP